MVVVSNKDYEDKAYIVFDDEYGLEKINHQNEDIPMVYFPVDDANYAIATLDFEINEVPLSFVAKTMGEYSITIDFDKGMFDYVELFDKVTGSVTNMLTGDYTFIATANDITDRFVIKLRKGDSVDKYYADNDVLAYVDDGNLIIDNVYEDAILDIYDVMGRRVLCDIVKGSGHTIEMNGIKAGLYVIRLSDKQGIRTQKIIFQ